MPAHKPSRTWRRLPVGKQWERIMGTHTNPVFLAINGYGFGYAWSALSRDQSIRKNGKERTLAKAKAAAEAAARGKR